MTWPFSRKREPEPRIQTLGEMIAYSLTSEITRAGWKTDSREKGLTNDALGVVIDEVCPRSEWLNGVKCRGAIVPLSSSDESTISTAMRAWRKWNDELRRSEALVSFVDAFEQVASPRSKPLVETPKSDSMRSTRAGNSAKNPSNSTS